MFPTPKKNDTGAYVINPSVIMAQAPVLLRQLLLVAGGVTAVLAFLKTKDLVGLYGYIQSEEFIPIFVAAAGLGSLLWGQAKAFYDRVRLVDIGKKAPNSIAVVKEANPPPAVPSGQDVG